MTFSYLEQKLLQAGLYRLDTSPSDDVLLGRHLRLHQVRGVLHAKLLRLGAKPLDDISMIYHHRNQLVSLLIPDAQQYLEFAGAQLLPTLWHLGVDLSRSEAAALSDVG